MINLQLVFKEQSLSVCIGNDVQAQHMYKEPGDNCLVYGKWYSMPLNECDSVGHDMEQCPYCNQWFDHQGIVEHQGNCRKQSEHYYDCPYCQKQCESESELSRHMPACSHNPKKTAYECSYCYRVFSDYNACVEHEKYCRYNNRPLICSKCQLYFSNEGELRLHHCRLGTSPNPWRIR